MAYIQRLKAFVVATMTRIEEYLRTVPKSQWKQLIYGGMFGGVCALILSLSIVVFLAPRDFEKHSDIVVREGSTLRDVAYSLKEQNAIRSPLLFQLTIYVLDGEERLQAGKYTFPQKPNVITLARALLSGEYQVPPRRIVIFEGMRVEQIGEILEHELGLDAEHFIEIAKPHEGYLFPETYFVPDAYTEEDVLQLLRSTFEEQMTEIEEELAASVLTLEEIVVLASILEREARSEESMRTVAGILLNRLEIGMPLQVDAAFEYYLDKSSLHLTYSDLKTDSPYNTYLYSGLPPTPIANPGMQAIRAVLNPIESDYYYYLTAPGGVFHYSRTFEEHRRNKALYL